jgi:hypothetical protein
MNSLYQGIFKTAERSYVMKQLRKKKKNTYNRYRLEKKKMFWRIPDHFFFFFFSNLASLFNRVLFPLPPILQLLINSYHR